MRTPAKLPAQLTGRSFTLAEAGAEGLAIGRLRAADLHTASRGIRVPWGAGQAFTDVLRPLTELTDDGVISHTTAARLHGIPLPPWARSELTPHVSRPRGKVRPKRRGVKGHETTLAPHHVVVFEGLRVTSLARTWVDLASVLPLEDLVVAADFLINAHSDEFPVPREPLLSLEQLGAVVAERKGNRGVAVAKRALDLARVGADSPPETLLRLRIVEAGLPEPDLNLVIRARTGNAVVWPDLGYKKYRISIQYDGVHHLGDEQQTWDLGRHASTDKAGWTQVTVSDATIKRIGWDGVVREIRHRLLAKGWRPENP